MANGTLIYRNIKQLESIISVSFVAPLRNPKGILPVGFESMFA